MQTKSLKSCESSFLVLKLVYPSKNKTAKFQEDLCNETYAHKIDFCSLNDIKMVSLIHWFSV